MSLCVSVAEDGRDSGVNWMWMNVCHNRVNMEVFVRKYEI